MKPKRCKINYRKIYESHYGEIPVDADGRSYEIHHIDGDQNNNEISNLVALTIEDHYKIHFDNGDYGAAMLISTRMKLSKEELSEIRSKSNIQRYANGTHPAQNPKHVEASRKRQLEKVKNGVHQWQTEKYRLEARERAFKSNAERIASNTHIFLMDENRERARLRNLSKSARPIVNEIKILSALCKEKHGYTLAKSGWNGKSTEFLEQLKEDLTKLLD